ncbi:MAG: hypothetical protein MJE68_02160 [Proteobacteria bacterium]|nr:hypothetical protein [Pseudomonadota bacterium]
MNAGVSGGSSQGLQTPQVSSSTVHMEHEIILAKKLKQKFISLQQEKVKKKITQSFSFTFFCTMIKPL